MIKGSAVSNDNYNIWIKAVKCKKYDPMESANGISTHLCQGI